MKKQSGFTLIELMIVIAIIGILAAIAIPAYQDYTIRSQASECLTLAAAAKTAISETYSNDGAVPANRTAAGMSPNATDTNGQYVTQVDVVGGEIICTYGGNANVNITGNTLVMTPYNTQDNSLAWQCSSVSPGPVPPGAVGALAGPTPGSIDARYVPRNCRT